MANDYDIVVAGGGPAGLSAARTASENGVEVLLLELQAQIGQTHTSAWVPSGFLKEDFSEAEKCSVKKAGLHSANRDLEIEGEFGSIIDREAFDKLLAYEAAKSGVEIWVGSPVTDLLTERGRVKGVRSEAGEWSEEIESEAVIDATGAKTELSGLFLRKVLNSDWDEEKINRTNEYLMANPSGGKKVDLYFSSILAPMGHGWIHPFDRKFSMVGVRGVRIHPDSALDEFIGRKGPSRLEKSVPIGAYRGRLPVEEPPKSTAEDGILAVGTAAGQIYPFSAHGMEISLEAGKIAGEVVSEGIKEGYMGKRKLADYDRLWRSRFEKKIHAGGLLQNAWETYSDRKMDALLEVLEGDSELQKSFVNIFRGEELEKSLDTLFKEDKCKEIFGKERVNNILSLYS